MREFALWLHKDAALEGRPPNVGVLWPKYIDIPGLRDLLWAPEERVRNLKLP